MLNHFCKDFLIYGSSMLLSRLLGLFLLPFFTAYLSPEQFGSVEMVTVIGAFVSITITMEISQGLARYFAAYEEDEELEEKTLVSSFLFFTFSCNASFVFVTMMWSHELSQLIFGDFTYIQTVQAGGLAIAATAFSTAVQTVLRFSGATAKYALCNFIGITIALLLSLLFIVRWKLGVPGFFLGQACGALLAILFGLISLVSLIDGRLSIKYINEMLGFSIPLVPAAIATVANSYIDRLLINSLVGIEALGVYAVAGRLAATAGLFAMSFQLTINPLIYRHYREPGAERDVAMILQLFLLLAFGIAAGVAMLAPELVGLLLDSAYWYVSKVLPLMFAAVLLANSYAFFPGLALAKRTGEIAIITVGAACLNALLNFLLLPLIGLIGGVYSAVCSSAVFILLWVWRANRRYFVPISSIRSISLLALLVTICAVAPIFLHELWIGVRIGVWMGLVILSQRLILGRDGLLRIRSLKLDNWD